MILKAILLGLVAMLGHTNFLFGTNLLDRPLIMCTLTGLVMGDLKSGIIIGAMMELAFIGHNIKNHRIIFCKFNKIQRFLPVKGSVNAVARFCELFFNQPVKIFFILGNKNSHTNPLFVQGDSYSAICAVSP